MSELSIIKHLCSHEFYTNHRDKLKLECLTREVSPVITTIDGYFRGGAHSSGATSKSKDDPADLSVDDLSNLFFSVPRPKAEFYLQMFEALKDNEATVDSTVTLIQGLQRASKLRELSMLAYDASEGKERLQTVIEQLEGLSTSDEDSTDSDDAEIDSFVDLDIVAIANKRRDMAGLRWRLNSLNQALGPLRKGNFGFVFARPETGKTTFLASEITYMAGQATQPIIWFNNEQEGDEVAVYIYRATLGMSLVELHRDLPKAKEMFNDATKGNFLLKDSASITKTQVEKICAKYSPALVVFDQIDKIQGFDNDREDLRLGFIYIWARELAKKYCPVIGVCQADGTGEGQRWLTMGNVANAKTSKQAEADWILGIGKVNEAGYENLRFMHLSKNKLPGGPEARSEMRHGRWETIIDPERARYVDL